MYNKNKKNHGGVDLFTKAADLRARLWYLLLFILVYRFGSYVPLPGINANAIAEFSNQQGGGILGMFNLFTGGALARMSIFALNIMPYITASIIMQLLSVLSTDLVNLKKEGEAGYSKINKYTKYLTVLLACIQGYSICLGLENISYSGGGAVYNPGYEFRIVGMFSLLGGTMFVLWIADQITSKCIGNGSSIIIYIGIASSMPSAIGMLFHMSYTGAISALFILFIMILVVALIYLIVFMESGQRRIPVQYPRRQVGNKLFNSESSHLPLKINTAGIIPPIFASSLLLFPATISSLVGTQDTIFNYFIANYLSHGKPLYILLYILLVMFFAFYYTTVVFNTTEAAENLKRSGAIVLGRRPGKMTAEYLDKISMRLTFIGSIYIALVCVLPELLIAKYAIPFYLGGTSLLIVVNVVLDLFSQIQTHLLSLKYDSLIAKSKMSKIL